MSITGKLYHGAVWNAVSQFGTQIINFVIILILARILGPAEFGLVGMVTVITSFLGYFTECGLIPSLIEKKNLDTEDFDTVFWSSLVFSAVLYAFVYWIGAPLIAAFYGNGQLTLIARVASLNFLVAPICFIPELLEVKRLRYSRITCANLISSVLSGVLGVILALSGWGVWSLVWQQIALTLTRGIVLNVIAAWRPRLRFSTARLRQLMGSGFHYTARNLLLYISQNIDYLIVGRLLGPAALGIYTLAFRMSKYAVLKLWGIFGKMLFPAFAIFKDDAERVRKNYQKVCVLGGLLLTPAFIFLFFGLDAIVPLVVGEQWLGVIPVVRIFIVYLLFESVSYADDSLMMAFGQVHKVNRIMAWSTAALFAAGCWLTRAWGIMGMAAAFTCVSIAHILVVKGALLKRIGVSPWAHARTLKKPAMLTVLLAVVLGGYSALMLSRVSHSIFLAGEMAAAGILILVFAYGSGWLRPGTLRPDIERITGTR